MILAGFPTLGLSDEHYVVNIIYYDTESTLSFDVVKKFNTLEAAKRFIYDWEIQQLKYLGWEDLIEDKQT